VKVENMLTYELTTSALCDMSCTYCFEGEKTNANRLKDYDTVIQRIHDTLDSDWFKGEFSGINLSFWGGEPTLNNKYILTLIEAFKDNDKVYFHMYSNGFDIDRMREIVDNVDMSKMKIQLSYDGGEINDTYRLTNKGLTTTQNVLKTFRYLAEKGVDVDLKSTLPMGALDKIVSSWDNFFDLHSEYEKFPNARIRYAPTIDYIQKKSDKNKTDVFRQQILQVAKREIDFFLSNGYHLMTWFGADSHKTSCSAGYNMIALDVDGKTYPCHGVLYADHKDEIENESIYNSEDFVKHVEQFNMEYKKSLDRPMPDICVDCEATYCVVCPAACFEASEKETPMDRWEDREVNGLCDFYKAFGEIDRTVQKYINTVNREG